MSTETVDQLIEKIEKEELASVTETPLYIFNFNELGEKLEQYLPNTTEALKLCLAVALSSQHNNPVLLWLLLVGAPSSGKTELIKLLKKSKMTYFVDTLTQNAFVSGERETEKKKNYDLLPKLDKKCLIVKDWTALFSADEKAIKKILGDLVNIFDQEFSKESASRGSVSYETEFSHIGAITPATLNRHTTYLNTVGARFLSYSIPELNQTQTESAFTVMFDEPNSRKQLKMELVKAIPAYLDSLVDRELAEIKPLSKAVRKFLEVAAMFVAHARGIVIIKSGSFKNEKSETITYYDLDDKQIEQPWRAVQQLKLLAQYLALVSGSDEVGIEELEIVKKVMLSSMPADRARALRVVVNAEGSITSKGLADSGEFVNSRQTARRLLEELTHLEILEKVPGSGTLATEYTIKDTYKSILTNSIAEFLERKELGTKIPDSTQLFSEPKLIDDLKEEKLSPKDWAEYYKHEDDVVLRRDKVKGDRWFAEAQDPSPEEIEEKSFKLQAIINELESRKSDLTVSQAVERIQGETK